MLQMQCCNQEVMLSLQEQVSLHLCIISFSPWSDLKCHYGHALETLAHFWV